MILSPRGVDVVGGRVLSVANFLLLQPRTAKVVHCFAESQLHSYASRRIEIDKSS